MSRAWLPPLCMEAVGRALAADPDAAAKCAAAACFAQCAKGDLYQRIAAMIYETVDPGCAAAAAAERAERGRCEEIARLALEQHIAGGAASSAAPSAFTQSMADVLDNPPASERPCPVRKRVREWVRALRLPMVMMTRARAVAALEGHAEHLRELSSVDAGRQHVEGKRKVVIYNKSEVLRLAIDKLGPCSRMHGGRKAYDSIFQEIESQRRARLRLEVARLRLEVARKERERDMDRDMLECGVPDRAAAAFLVGHAPMSLYARGTHLAGTAFAGVEFKTMLLAAVRRRGEVAAHAEAMMGAANDGEDGRRPHPAASGDLSGACWNYVRNGVGNPRRVARRMVYLLKHRK